MRDRGSIDYLSMHLGVEELERLFLTTVGFAGAGGLGSNCALMLARSGIGRFLLLDGDVVEASNLNRQIYFPRHTGRNKVEALAEIIRELNQDIQVDARVKWLKPDDFEHILPQADLWVEALDDPELKKIMIREALKAGVFVVGASGLGGYGKGALGRRVLGGGGSKMRAVLVGDFSTAVDAANPPLAPRVIQASAMQADAVLEYVLG